MSATPTQNDSFPLPGYEDRLWAELDQLHAELAVAAEHGGSRRPHRDHQRRSYLLVVGGVAAAAVLGVFALFVREDGSTSTSSEGDPVPETTAPPPTEAVDPAEAPRMIVVREMQFADGTTSTTWQDEETGTSHMVQLQADGSRGWEDGTVVTTDDDGSRSSQQTAIDHVTGEYQVFPAVPVEAEFAPGWEEREILGSVESGGFVLDGTEVVDGVEVERYLSVPMTVTPPGISRDQLDELNRQSGVRTVWIDPTTRRLVKDQTVGSSYDFTTTYRYLERTPENLALVELVIPEGFREVEEMSRGVG